MKTGANQASFTTLSQLPISLNYSKIFVYLRIKICNHITHFSYKATTDFKTGIDA
jgi:hypothetical protein